MFQIDEEQFVRSNLHMLRWFANACDSLLERISWKTLKCDRTVLSGAVAILHARRNETTLQSASHTFGAKNKHADGCCQDSISFPSFLDREIGIKYYACARNLP